MSHPSPYPTPLPQSIADVEQLEELLSRPTPAAIRAMAAIDGDVIVLGAAGKMGPTLARMVRRASDAAGVARRVIAVSRFSQPGVRQSLESYSVETIAGDLLDQTLVDSLPDASNVVFMAGVKFGASGNEPLTWAMNVYLPTIVCRRYASSRIAAFSTGNVYGLTPVARGGSLETDPLQPVGEYAMSCLGRERMFEYFSQSQGTPTAIIRLNYAIDMRYGVLVDLAHKVFEGQSIDVGMGYVNVIWQADASALTLCALPDASSPATILNVAGPEILRTRDVCARFGQLLGKTPRLLGEEWSDALLNNGSEAHRRYGPPLVDAETMIGWVADWVARGGPQLGKPTHFEVRDGKF
jgi:nucleoside-diphosphate-sugar epimerase